MSSSSFYEMLKWSPLSKEQGTASLEEVIVWLDVNGYSTKSSIMKIIKAIDKNFHDWQTDRLVDYNASTFCKILRNSRYGLSGQCMPNALGVQMPLKTEYFSDHALNWIFKIFSETNAFDSIALDKAFISSIGKMKAAHRVKSKQWKTLGTARLPMASYVDQQLYEVFAELLDILEDKLTKRCQSLPS